MNKTENFIAINTNADFTRIFAYRNKLYNRFLFIYCKYADKELGIFRITNNLYRRVSKRLLQKDLKFLLENKIIFITQNKDEYKISFEYFIPENLYNKLYKTS